ncbi:hypothetical protein [Empedobacter brevis]|uniref:hypothetical protein n=1 Tax=Empedobacter brevis TaxID=247 RepID=UPI0028A26052|nr:hypothetical protein [Empedobacter brevis]
MKKHLIILMSLFPVSFLFSQVGINTENPQGIFHVDGEKDNPTTGNPSVAAQANDFIVTAAGNVGIGITNPTRKLEIVSTTSPSFRLNDGSQQTGYYLVSDANGNGSWKSLTTSIAATFPATGYSGAVNSTGYSGVSITLPPGQWLILTNILLKGTNNPSGGNGAWVRLQWSRSQGSANTSGITGSLNSGIFVAPYGLATGSSIINNSSSSDTTFYLNLSGTDIFGSYTGNWDNLGAAVWQENSIIAYPAN